VQVVPPLVEQMPMQAEQVALLRYSENWPVQRKQREFHIWPVS
jgi:hypothetical protein